MKDYFNKMFDLIEADYKYSEWARKCNFKKRLETFLSEAEEIKKAIENNDTANLKEEIGDALWDLVYAIYSGEKEGLFKSEEVFSEVMEKIKRRKPWALEGKEVSKEEELIIWNKVKKKGKEGFYD